MIQAADEEGHVDIGGERLGLDDGDDEGGIGLGDSDPVAGDGEVERRVRRRRALFRFEFEDAAAKPAWRCG